MQDVTFCSLCSRFNLNIAVFREGGSTAGGGCCKNEADGNSPENRLRRSTKAARCGIRDFSVNVKQYLTQGVKPRALSNIPKLLRQEKRLLDTGYATIC